MAYISQDTKRPEVLKESFEIEFDSVQALNRLPENLEVAKAVQLLMNARARREAIDKMDQNDYSGAQALLNQVAVSTQVLFSRMPSPAVREELEELAKMEDSLNYRENDKMGRKQMMYSAYKKSKGK